MTKAESVTGLTDEQLLAEVNVLARRERHATAQLIAALGELDSRRLYLGQGYSSMFTYCTQRLHLSEHAAYARIEAARAARRYPLILGGLADGSLTLTTVCLLARHLTPANHRELLRNARFKSRREIERQVAVLHPLAAVRSHVRKLPTPTPRETETRSCAAATRLSFEDGSVAKSPIGSSGGSDVTSTRRPPTVTALDAERYKVQLTIDHTTHQTLREVQDLFRHVTPSGDLSIIFERALALLLAELKRRTHAHVVRPRSARRINSRSRYVAASVRREVWTRDAGRCTFVGADGRCAERGFLEFHHVRPFAKGGPTTSMNLQLRCRAHNAYEATREFGDLLTGL